MKTFKVTIPALTLAILFALFAFSPVSSMAQSCPEPVRLHSPLPEYADIQVFDWIPDQSGRIAYLVNLGAVDVYDLFTVPGDGSGPPIFFDIGLPAGREVSGLPRFNHDGSVAIFRSNAQNENVEELYSVATNDGGTTPTKISGTLVAGGNVEKYFEVAANGTVVYLAYQDSAAQRELFRTDLQGTNVLKLNNPLNVGDQIERDMALSPNGQYVVYRATRNSVTELYARRLDSGTPIKLNGTLQAGTGVSSFSISPDSQHVVYVANQDDAAWPDLYSVPIAGGSTLKLSGIERLESDPLSQKYAFAPDSVRVVYFAEEMVGGVWAVQIYSVLTTGGQRQRLNSDLQAGGQLREFKISPDSSQVAYVAQLGPYPAPVPAFLTAIDGSTTPARVSESSDPLAYVLVSNIEFTSDGVHLVYRLTPGGSTFVNATNLLTFAETTLSDSASESVQAFTISASNQFIVYQASFDGHTQIFQASISGGEKRRLNGDLVAGGNVFGFAGSYHLSPDDLYVAYRADQERDNVSELWSVSLICSGDIFADGFEG